MTSSLRTGSTRAARPAQLQRAATGRRVALPIVGVAAVAAIATTIALTPASPVSTVGNVPSVAQLAQSGAQTYTAGLAAGVRADAGQAPAGTASTPADLGRGDAVSIAVETPKPTPTPTQTPEPSASGSSSGGSSSSPSGGGSSASGSSGGGYVTPSGEAQQIAHDMVLGRGWGEDQFACLVNLWNKESGWNTHAANSSGAYGIPQALPGSKMGTVGSDWQDNPATQITWGLGYIASTYGTPCNAWSSFQSKGWY